MALNARQTRFVNEYVTNGYNATKAALAAGYSEKTARTIGSENLTKPDIKAAIDAFLEENTISAKAVLARISSIASGQREGVEIPHELKALELLGKAHSLFTDKVEHSGELSINYVSDWRNENAGD